MSNKKINKHYISDIDLFLQAFDQSHALSESQKNEIKKHQRVFECRDNPRAKKKAEDLWEAF